MGVCRGAGTVTGVARLHRPATMRADCDCTRIDRAAKCKRRTFRSIGKDISVTTLPPPLHAYLAPRLRRRGTLIVVIAAQLLAVGGTAFFVAVGVVLLILARPSPNSLPALLFEQIAGLIVPVAVLCAASRRGGRIAARATLGHSPARARQYRVRRVRRDLPRGGQIALSGRAAFGACDRAHRRDRPPRAQCPRVRQLATYPLRLVPLSRFR